MEEGNFNTNVGDKDERQRIRRERVEQRSAAANQSSVVNKNASNLNTDKKSEGQQQIAQSLSHLDKKKSSGISSVTSIRVNADFRENQRRIAEEKLRQVRKTGKD